MSKVLVAEISGKRPGTSKQRPTEKLDIQYDKIIVSNNSEGYETDWEILNVPQDYRDWYTENVKCSENAWYAPMNRSYAIKYAREQGYDYLMQLDDNIVLLQIMTYLEDNGIITRRRIQRLDIMNDIIEMFVTVLENTNAVMVGGQLAGIGTGNGDKFMFEGYVYSMFCLKLSKCPSVFQGDFEDDIEYRLKCRQMGYPVVQLPSIRYGKTGQQKTKDMTGCRAEYVKAGLTRGEHMMKLYPDMYKCRMTRKGHSVMSKDDGEPINFKHYLKPFKVGVLVYDKDTIITKWKAIVAKYNPLSEKAFIKTKKVRCVD